MSNTGEHRLALSESGDAWVTAADGAQYWGKYGAAGVLAYDPSRGFLLQHRSPRTAAGNTWGIPGGARHRSENSLTAALREVAEECGIAPQSLTPLYAHRVNKGGWHYTTIIALADSTAEATPLDWESLDFRWIPKHELPDYPLHPNFAQALPHLLPLFESRHAIVVDAANVIGAMPNGWWRDRGKATADFIAQLTATLPAGVPPELCGISGLSVPGMHRCYPRWIVVTEGAANSAVEVAAENTPATAQHTQIAQAAGSGDDELVHQVQALISENYTVTVCTSDRELKSRVTSIGARTQGAKTLWQHIATAAQEKPAAQ
ncbi:NUDIX hydrolase [Canibacter sp. lx-72]|uniref:NUDIX domain-containing protein n=1 Tax=Canibacter zhuwentaonis TaxID=2837491 RepID=UPI001BDBFD87|nr:NUDIX hydrolase [Canibacter zhuwentaonis]MBT1018387.1 NUDIX hydrolase [Canibacter zhuwentaonis]